ncbi:MAG: 3-phosphoshikimate 1-carboxyvinyltransferase [Thermodesulfobacteriota bacterium]|nr:3-phosphoshikimate 1-carboxyvinyltransferase [Thermodesulfobacteriota bacterium]
MKEIRQINNLNASVAVPGSKSYTQRALVIASLAGGKSFLRNALLSEDTKHLINALRSLGAGILVAKDDIILTGTDGRIEDPGKTIHLGNNGTALRFLATLVSIGSGHVTLDGSIRLRERPVKPLLEALETLGVVSQCVNGYPPVTVQGGGLRGGRVVFTNTESSQYISSVLISAPYSQRDVELELRGMTFSMPYIDMTIDVMRHFGVEVEKKGQNEFKVNAQQKYAGRKYLIEADVSSASYFFVAAALTGGKIKVENINPETRQGDIAFLRIIESLGCHVSRDEDFVEVTGKGLIKGDYEFDMSDMPDMVPSLAILAAFREGVTVIKNVSHLRLKESNRLEALVNELSRTGIDAEESADGLIIRGGVPHGAEIETYNDHRIAMSFAVAGLVVPGIKIKDKKCVKKSFPAFWDEFKKLYI